VELLLLLLAVPILWLLLLPARVVGRARKLPLAGPGVLAIIVVAGWFTYGALQGERTEAGDYAPGDTALRAILD
jgi:hypothetical protein